MKTSVNTSGKDWTIQGLKLAMDQDIKACKTAHEKIMVKSISGKEIRKLAEHLANIGKLTPAGKAIAEEYGYIS